MKKKKKKTGTGVITPINHKTPYVLFRWHGSGNELLNKQVNEEGMSGSQEKHFPSLLIPRHFSCTASNYKLP